MLNYYGLSCVPAFRAHLPAASPTMKFQTGSETSNRTLPSTSQALPISVDTASELLHLPSEYSYQGSALNAAAFTSSTETTQDLHCRTDVGSGCFDNSGMCASWPGSSGRASKDLSQSLRPQPSDIPKCPSLGGTSVRTVASIENIEPLDPFEDLNCLCASPVQEDYTMDGTGKSLAIADVPNMMESNFRSASSGKGPAYCNSSSKTASVWEDESGSVFPQLEDLDTTLLHSALPSEPANDTSLTQEPCLSGKPSGYLGQFGICSGSPCQPTSTASETHHLMANHVSQAPADLLNFYADGWSQSRPESSFVNMPTDVLNYTTSPIPTPQYLNDPSTQYYNQEIVWHPPSATISSEPDSTVNIKSDIADDDLFSQPLPPPYCAPYPPPYTPELSSTFSPNLPPNQAPPYYFNSDTDEFTPMVHLANWSSKDDYLVQQKRAGLTYKEIKAQGGFSEAESTLRGRYRNLTKRKEDRVRRPEWQFRDIELLREAVEVLGSTEQVLAKGTSGESTVGTRTRIPWKKVADYIAENGGSYHFGNATCRKKWDEVIEEDRRGTEE